MAGAIDKESKMKFIACAATLVFLLWGAPALAGPCVDTDSDGVCDVADNCTLVFNPLQTDSDLDDCGNVCDYDVDNVEAAVPTVALFDIFAVVPFLGLINPPTDLTLPIGDNVALFDIFEVVPFLGGVSGPSGTTAGTVRCP